MLNLNDLRAFAKVVEHGGFTAASRMLGEPKSTLSKRVAALEQSLGARLLNRNSRNIALTPLGEDVLTHARAMIIESEAAQGVVDRRRSEPAGTVRITCGTITAQYHLAPLWPILLRQHPRLVPMVHATDRMADIVAEGFDLALRDHVLPLPDSELVQQRLGKEPDYLVASPRLASRQPVETVEALKEVPVLGNGPTGRGETWNLRRGSEVVSVEPRVRFASDDPSSVLTLTLAGEGIARLPRVICEPAISAGTLVRVLPEWQAEGPFTTLLYPSRRGQLPAVRAVIDMITAELGRTLKP